MKPTRVHDVLYYHLVWSTKERASLIVPSVEQILYPFIKNKAKELDAEILEIGGIEDHIHLLVRLKPKHSVAKFVKDIKGSSSHYLTHLAKEQWEFQWQLGYGVFTVSEAVTPKISQYIRNQKQHHQAKSIFDDMEL